MMSNGKHIAGIQGKGIAVYLQSGGLYKQYL